MHVVMVQRCTSSHKASMHILWCCDIHHLLVRQICCPLPSPSKCNFFSISFFKLHLVCWQDLFFAFSNLRHCYLYSSIQFYKSKVTYMYFYMSNGTGNFTYWLVCWQKVSCCGIIGHYMSCEILLSFFTFLVRDNKVCNSHHLLQCVWML